MMNLHSTDIRLETATVEYLDGQLIVLANDSTVAVTLTEPVVDEIRDELNTVYAVAPATEDALFVTRVSDHLQAVVTTDIPESLHGWGFTFLAHLRDERLLGRFGAESAIAAAKMAFASYDHVNQVEADMAAEVAS